ncbi:hypothetical protein [Singulisphaera sp. PoT]|uniref:hypothetical protein n=1 Tax=Singulisphaera sp. PoT TaxID=3411797 RepID=UPI003BF54CE3
MFASVFVFSSDRPSWGAIAGCVALVIGSFGLLLWSILRRDKAPDYLRKLPGRPFERDGLCFTNYAGPSNGRCYLDVYFQSRYDQPSKAMISLQPSKGFFLNRGDLSSMTVQVECPAAGFGVTRIPWPVGKKFQGKKQALDVGADVFYPEGRGTMVRYRGGLHVGRAGFDTWKVIQTVAGALGGMIVYSKPARIKLRLPCDVEESVGDDLPISTVIIWKQGDAPGDLSSLLRMAKPLSSRT